MTASWGGWDEWSRREPRDAARDERAEDRAPDSRDQIPAERWAALAARHRPPRHGSERAPEARHVGRESSQSLAGRLAALQAAHATLADDHAALLGRYDRLLTEAADLARERDAWRKRAADAEQQSPSRLGSWAAGFVSALCCLGAWVALGHFAAALVRRLVGG